MSNKQMVDIPVRTIIGVNHKALLNIMATKQLLVNTIYYYNSIYKRIEMIGKGFKFDCIQVYLFNNLFQVEKISEWINPLTMDNK